MFVANQLINFSFVSTKKNYNILITIYSKNYTRNKCMSMINN